MKNRSTFKSKHEVYQINKNFNCNSKVVVYWVVAFAKSNAMVVP